MTNQKTNTIELKKLMIENGIDSITALSKATNINRNTLSAVLNGDAQPSSYVMYRLVDALHIQPANAGVIFFA